MKYHLFLRASIFPLLETLGPSLVFPEHAAPKRVAIPKRKSSKYMPHYGAKERAKYRSAAPHRLGGPSLKETTT